MRHGFAALIIIVILGIAAVRDPIDQLRAAAERLDVTLELEWKYPKVLPAGVVDGRNATRGEIEVLAGVIACELDFYPPDFIKRFGLRRIILGKDLSFNGQRRMGMPDSANNALYLDVTPGLAYGKLDVPFARRTIHHELMHMVDWADDHQMFIDDGWEALNPSPFKYLGGGEQMRGDYAGQLKEMPNFLNSYSTASVAEDKAEIFSYLMTNDKFATSRLYFDPVLHKKADLLKVELKKFSPSINEYFWSIIAIRS